MNWTISMSSLLASRAANHLSPSVQQLRAAKKPTLPNHSRTKEDGCMSKEDFPSGPSSKPLPPHLSSFHPADEPASPDWFNPIYDDAPAVAPFVASAQTKAPELSDEPEQQTNGIDKSIEARADKIASRVASEGGFG